MFFWGRFFTEKQLKIRANSGPSSGRLKNSVFGTFVLKYTDFGGPVFSKNPQTSYLLFGPIFEQVFIDFGGPVWGPAFNINQQKAAKLGHFKPLQDKCHMGVAREAVPVPIFMVFWAPKGKDF